MHLCSRQHCARSPRISPDVRVVISKQCTVNLGQYDVTDVATNVWRYNLGYYDEVFSIPHKFYYKERVHRFKSTKPS